MTFSSLIIEEVLVKVRDICEGWKKVIKTLSFFDGDGDSDIVIWWFCWYIVASTLS